MNIPRPAAEPGHVRRHGSWRETTTVSSIGRRTLHAIPNYRLLRAATRVDASPAARLLLVHLIGYLGPDETSRPESRFVVFPGNARLAEELRCTPRSIQRQADELEGMGVVRRCYNGLNRRVAFDLTPFAVRHEEMLSDVVAIHTERRMARERAQMELSLGADRIERPATSASPRGDAGVTHNSTGHRINDGEAVADVLDSFDVVSAASVLMHSSVGQDRTEYLPDAVLSSITERFARGGLQSSLGWGAALSAMGRDRAVALYLVAEADPRRRATPERYFGWLLRVCAAGDGDDVVDQAAGRAAKAIRAAPRGEPGRVAADLVIGACEAHAASGGDPEPRPPVEEAEAEPAPHASPAAPSTAAAMPAPVPPPSAASRCGTAMKDAMRTGMGAAVYDSWLREAVFEDRGTAIVVTARNPFAAQWIETNLCDDMERIASRVCGTRTSVMVREA